MDTHNPKNNGHAPQHPLTYHICHVPNFAYSTCVTPPIPPADNINLTSPWLSDMRCDYPMEVGLELTGNNSSGALVSSLKLTAHETFTPKKIEIFIGVAGEEVEDEDKASPNNRPNQNPYSTALWKRLGFVSFQTGQSESGNRRRETKTVDNINLRCKFLKLIVHEPALTGVECQVGLCSISLFGLDSSIAYMKSLGQGPAPVNPDLIVAQALRNLTDEPINLPTGMHEMEAALFEAGVDADIIGTTVTSVEARIDEDTLKHINEAKAECKEACDRDDFQAAKMWKERAEGLVEVGKEVWRVREQERAAAMKDDFDLAIVKSNEGKALGLKRESLLGGWGAERGEEKKEEGNNNDNDNYNDNSDKWKKDAKMHFAYPSIVESNKEFKGIAALEEIVYKVERRSVKVDKGAEDPVSEMLGKIKHVHGATSTELGLTLSKVLNETVGSKLLGYLVDSQEGSTQKFALNCLCKAVKKGELKTLPTLDRVMINAMTVLVEHGMKAEGGEWKKAAELMKLVFCSPTREDVFETTKVKFGDVRDCLGRLIRKMCDAALFSNEESNENEKNNEKEGNEKFAKAAIVSLSRQSYIGYGLVSSLIDDRQGMGYEIKCTNMLITEALVEEYGVKGDSKIDVTDCLNRVGAGLGNVNDNVRKRSAGVVRSLMERDILNEKFFREVSEGWGLDDGGFAYLAREYARDRVRLADIKAKKLEGEAREEAAVVAKEAERLKVEARKLAEKEVEEQRWRTQARGKQLFKFVGEDKLDALAKVDTTIHAKKLTPEEEEDERMRLIIEGKVPGGEIKKPSTATTKAPSTETPSKEGGEGKGPEPEKKKSSREEGDFADVDHLTKENIEDFDKNFPSMSDSGRLSEKGEGGKGEEKEVKKEEVKKEEEKKEEKKEPPAPKKEPEKPKPTGAVAAPDAKTPDDDNVVVKKKKGGGCQIS
ncbi:hypothetical protein TL16_g06526 [Triparma laevis f. inornata]|uniref:Centrosomal protein CEP104 N-terminal domain-containing protein n=1 Tax=Triparma laevis f. inornata TaxID=1714386 RepID=A0A9W7EAW8_9STRA|nr:hypothetical protein TL16_g06526 [Triparma laevis f. inornata]